jgi:hypothetical protein
MKAFRAVSAAFVALYGETSEALPKINPPNRSLTLAAGHCVDGSEDRQDPGPRDDDCTGKQEQTGYGRH